MKYKYEQVIRLTYPCTCPRCDRCGRVSAFKAQHIPNGLWSYYCAAHVERAE